MNHLLDNINSPKDLKRLPVSALPELCREIRDFLIENASQHPGHLGANLGVVELTVAIHYVFDVPTDKLIFDVGHQAYVHKILTGRRNRFATNRSYKGLSGFPSRSESQYDAFGTGHSSTSVSAALGIATALKAKGSQATAIAVIGDGALTGGEAYEALNNAGAGKQDILVILNDNNMAIDHNVGAIKDYLLKITKSPAYNRFRESLFQKTLRFKYLSKYLSKIKRSTKSFLLRQSNLFESLGFRYFGPVDGHDVIYLVEVLNDLKNIPGPKLMHIMTVKGKGYRFAEENKTLFHAPGHFDVETGKSDVSSQNMLYQDVFGQTLISLARENSRIVAVTPAMCSGSGLTQFRELFPERLIDVGIAEQHAVTFAAGYATEGFIPFCVIYSTFMQRAFDQLVHDVALQNLPVVICLDRAGLVGSDGATHHGAFDMAYTRFVPNLTIAAPMDPSELRSMMYTAQTGKYGPFVIRYPKGRIPSQTWETPMEELIPGKGRILSEGEGVAVISIGSAGVNVSKAVNKLLEEGIRIGHIDIRYLKPLDRDLLESTASRYQHLITVEDGVITGGLYSAIAEFLKEEGLNNSLRGLGIPSDRFVMHGDNSNLYKECGYDTDSIFNAVKSYFG